MVAAPAAHTWDVLPSFSNWTMAYRGQSMARIQKRIITVCLARQPRPRLVIGRATERSIVRAHGSMRSITVAAITNFVPTSAARLKSAASGVCNTASCTKSADGKEPAARCDSSANSAIQPTSALSDQTYAAMAWCQKHAPIQCGRQGNARNHGRQGIRWRQTLFLFRR